MPPRLRWNWWTRPSEDVLSVQHILNHILTRLRALEAQGRELLMASQETNAILKRMDVATTNIAADIRRLKDRSDDPELKAGLEAAASRLEAMAADPDNPDPLEGETGTTGAGTTDTTGGSGTSDSTDANASRRRR